MNQVQVLKTPIKSAGDKKDYRLIKLPNGLKALLVRKSNENTGDSNNEDLAAANVTVEIGSFDDPKKVQGLAHFLEHMVHMGSVKYPEESSYNDFLTANGGKRNAMTSATYTSYFFAVSEKAFPEAVDRLEQLMESPLLLQNSMQREREAVDSEFQMQKSNDAARLQSVFKDLIFENHPASRFNCGNLITLKDEITDDNLHKELLKLHEKHVANKMVVVLQSKRTLDEMQELVVKSFSSIHRGNEVENPQPLAITEIFKPEFFNKIHYIKPKTSKKAFCLTWALPSMAQHYKCDPLEYIKKIFKNNGEGGISTYLREKHLVTSIGVYLEQNSFISNSSYTLVRLLGEMTDEGVDKIEEILEAVFSYLLMIKETPIEEHRRFYNELKEKSEKDFSFHEESVAFDNVLDYATNMVTFQQEDYIQGNNLFQVFDEQIISKVIDSLNQKKFNVIILDNKHQTYNKQEKYYDTEYDEVDAPESFQKLWNERKANPKFFLEKSNPFKPENFEIYENEEETPKFPAKILDNLSFETWHKLDKKFKNPFVIMKLNLFSPVVNSSKENCIMMKVYDKVLTFNLKRKLAQATSAGFSMSTSTDKNGFALTFSGYNDKISLFVDSATKFLPNALTETNEATFNVLKKDLKDSFYEMLNSTAVFSNGFMDKLLIKDNYSRYELYHEIDNVSYEGLKEFAAKFFKNLKVQVLIQGNMRKSEGSSITQLVLNNLKCEHLVDMFEVKSRCYQVPLGESMVRIKSLMVDDDNSLIRDYYQIGHDTLRARCLGRLVVAILNPKAYDYLRSKEQLGYGVGVQFEEKGRIIGINILVLSQESKHTYEEVGRKMKIFMNEVSLKTIEELTDDEFENFKDARVKLLSAEDLDLNTEVSRNTYEINNQEYIFEKNELAVKLTKAFSKQELQEFFKSFTQADKVRKLSVQVIGNRKKIEGADVNDRFVGVEFITEKLNADEKIISDIEAFQNTAYLYPVAGFQLE